MSSILCLVTLSPFAIKCAAYLHVKTSLAVQFVMQLIQCETALRHMYTHSLAVLKHQINRHYLSINLFTQNKNLTCKCMVLVEQFYKAYIQYTMFYTHNTLNGQSLFHIMLSSVDNISNIILLSVILGKWQTISQELFVHLNL